MIFPTIPNLSTASEDIRFPNTMSSVPCSRGKVKFSSSLSDSQNSSLSNDIFQKCRASKSNQTVAQGCLRNYQLELRGNHLEISLL